MILSHLDKNPIRRPLCAALSAALIAAPAPSFAAITTIADEPLASGTTVEIKPNILFILDDSGSMGWEYMPNAASDSSKSCYKHYGWNRIYYNPNVTYSPPPKGDGSTFFPNSVFTDAPNNGYDSGSSKTNLSSSSTYKQYNTRSSFTPGTCHSSGYSAVTVSSTSGPGGTDERTNYANWYSYYRNRLMTMKAAAGFAFNGAGLSKYRVGFITINPNSPVTSSKFLPIKDFDATQKQAWFNKLYEQSTNGGTPLRISLARAGRHYAGIATGTNAGMGSDDGTGKLTADTDPVLYSCQQNFSILTSDGFWNDGSNPNQLDGTTDIGNQDFDPAVTPRPLLEASSSTVTVTTTVGTETEVETGSGCSSTRTKIVLTRNVNVTTKTYKNGVLTGTTGPTNEIDDSDATSCSKSTRALQSPNPKQINTTVASGGGVNTLADVAQYYYATDLRAPGHLGGTITNADGTTYREDVGTLNNVPKTGDGPEDDKAAHQHMTTFTLGMGVPGNFVYQSDYKTATTGDFAAIRAGTKNWPVPIEVSSSSTTDLNKTDDLWHAAVNGRGTYFSASDPTEVANGLKTALSGISNRVGSAAAAATSNLEPIAGDNFAYVASYETQSWEGDIQAREINLTTGNVGTAVIWSAQAKLQSKVTATTDSRTIYTFDGATSNKLKNFLYADLTAAEKDMFSAAAGPVDTLTQWTSTDPPPLTAAQQANAIGANLVNYIRGQFGYENRDPANAVNNRVFRQRDFVLGDIVNAQPVFVGDPFFEFTDVGYKGAATAFKESKSGRDKMVYVASNDGMLHAFYAGSSTSDTNGGVERWAYIPSVILPKLYLLADYNYKALHQFTTDGTPTIGDACTGTACNTSPSTATASDWKTMLVAGLNKGGKAYYALDITDPGSPKAMWEFKHSTTCYDAANAATHYADCHLGFTYGNPVITKRTDGKWVVLVTSGYNNVNATPITGDGVGYLYVLDAKDGKILDKISTGAGDSTTPSNLAKINNWVDSGLTDNTTLRVYGGDMLGNIWRFDINNNLVPTGKEAFKVAQLLDPSNVGQPITTKLELSEINSVPVIYAATGRYLGSPDLGDTQVQSIYAIKDTKVVSHCSPTPCTDPAAPTTITGLRSGTLVKQSMTNTTDSSGAPIRTVTCASSCSATGGWFVDLPDSKERVNVDMKLQLGTLVVASNVPGGSSCTIGGYSWLNFFDYDTGSFVSGSAGNSVAKSLSSSLAVGLNIVRLPSGKTVVIATTSDNQQLTVEAPFATPGVTGKRVTWREILE